MTHDTRNEMITPDDVQRLIHGKPSKNRVGSRQVRHRLRQDELERLKVARNRGFLLVTKSTRAALQNSWHLDCQARAVPCVVVERINEEFRVITPTGIHVVATFDQLTEFVSGRKPA